MSKRHSTVNKEESPAAKLQAMMQAEQLKRAQACLAEINQVLQKHNCRMRPEFFAADGKMEGRVNVIANPKGQ